MTLPAGKYYIGDPCYVIDDDKWSDFCDILFKGNGGSRNDEVTDFEGHPMFASGTAYGDGSYEGSDGVVYGVDAGLIGIVPVALIKKRGISEARRLGSIVTFKKPFEAYKDDAHTFHFGDIDIPTGDVEEDDEDTGEDY